MAVDFQRILQAAAAAALDDSTSGGSGPGRPAAGKRRSRGPRAFLVGAGLMTAGRIVVKARRGGGLLEELHQRLLDYEQRHFAENAGGDDEDPYALDDADGEGEVDLGEQPTDENENEPEGEHDDEAADEYDDEEPAEDDEADQDEPADEEESDAEPSGVRTRGSAR